MTARLSKSDWRSVEGGVSLRCPGCGYWMTRKFSDGDVVKCDNGACGFEDHVSLAGFTAVRHEQAIRLEQTGG